MSGIISSKDKQIRLTVIGLLITLLFFSNNLYPLLEESGYFKENGWAAVTGKAEPVKDTQKTRYGSVIIEDFNNFTSIDISNTTSIVNTYTGRAYLPGSGTNPRSDIRDVSNADRTRNFNRFTGRAVGQDGKFYIRSSRGSNQISIYASLNSFMNNGNTIGSFNLPFNPHSYYQMIYANGHLYFSNSNTVDKLRLSDKSKVPCSMSAAGSTSWGWGGGSQCGLTTDGEYIYTYSNNLVRVYDMNENLIRSVNIPEQQRSMGTCFSAGHYFYPVGYSRGNMAHRLDGDSGNVENYNDVCMNGFDYLTCFNYDYFGNSLVMTNGNAGNNPDTTWTIDNLCYNFGGTGGLDYVSFLQSKPLYQKLPTIGAARITWFEHKPQGTDIVYNMTVDGKNWVTMENGTNHVFKDRGSCLIWNATLTTNDNETSPYIDKIIIEYDLIADPVPFSPSSSEWQGSSTPTLKWNFTDPDKGDHQSDYLVEIYDNENLENLLYNTSFVNSTFTEHTIAEPLNDGIYYWRVRTKDSYHAASNFSLMKKFMIDVTKPVGNITIEEDVLSVNEKLVDLAINATDNGSGVVDMQVISDRGDEGPWEEYKTEKRIALTPTDGLKTIGVRFKDNAGIISEIYNDSIYLDYNAPGDIVMGSSTHPDPLRYYNSTLPVFDWELPHEVSGIKGYSYMVDSSQMTEPPKVLYTQNSHLTGTYPGEFAGLTDGTWYFHITACDIYDQWGNATHFLFNIDSADPFISELAPSADQWFNVTVVGSSFICEDIYGLDTATIAYSWRKEGESTFASWTDKNMDFEVLETGSDGSLLKVRAWTDLPVSEGSGNAVKWRITDLAGNGPVISQKRSIRVDRTPVVASDFIPEVDEMFSEDEAAGEGILCGVTFTDAAGSGVDGKSIEYSISKWGGGDKYFVNWTSIANNMVKETMDVLINVRFEAGRDNYIKWRAKDAVGNAYAFSESVKVRINSPPIPVIDRPADDAIFEQGSPIHLNATGTEDREGDELSYYWEIKGKTSKKTVFKGHGMSSQATIDQLGEYQVYLYVNDGNGYNESLRLDIEVESKPTEEEAEERWEDTADSDGDGLPDWWEKINGLDPLDSADGTPEIVGEYNQELNDQKAKSVTKGSFLTQYWWLFVIIGVIVLIVIIVSILLAAEKKKKEKKREIAVPAPPPKPYYPYSQGQNLNVAPVGYKQLDTFGSGGVYGGRTLQSGAGKYPPLALPQGPGAPSPRTSFQPGMPGNWGQQPVLQSPPSLPVNLQTTSTSNEPNYLLPTFSTDLGMQDMNLLSLPPASESPVSFADAMSDPLSTIAHIPDPSAPPIGIDPITFEPPDSPLSALFDIPGEPPIPSLSSPGEPLYPQNGPGSPEAIPASPPPAPPETTASPLPDTPVPSVEGPPVGDTGAQVQCHACGTGYVVTDTARPVIIECPVCHEQGYLSE
ncbi:MAG: hypothetical protein QF682_12100 [Candidatus Thermoplasmatota archaeon]|jgi:hypothetical protein|nr:hypothetical protein [Candidatus Thermoplasmatota archaeon]